MNLKVLKELLKNLSVLYVEDDDTLRATFTAYLNKLFFNVVSKSNGEEGLQEYKNNSYDIIITDINMPKMTGLEMASQIRLLNSEQHILIVSAYKDIQNYIEAIRIGIDGYILKPIEFEQVNATIYKIAKQIKEVQENIKYKDHLEELVLQKTEQLKKKYIIDDLTSLPNRNYLEELIAQNLVNTIVLLNVDNFSIINHNFGFEVGDQLLKMAAFELKDFENETFTLIRLQSDEFIFFSQNEALEEAKGLVSKIQAHFNAKKIVYKKISVNLTFSYAIDSSSYRELLKTTSLALQEVRLLGNNHIGVYSENSSFEKKQKQNLFWLGQIREYIENDNIKVLFQPLKDIKNNEIIKYEALTRVVSPDGSLVLPGEFLEALSLTGLMPEFTKKVILKALEAIEGTNIIVSVNITHEDFADGYLLEFLKQNCKKFGIKHEQIIIEVLEQVSSINETDSLKQLHELQKNRFQIAIDDFGTEHSNFGRLLTLNVDFIKIDGSFIKNIDSDTNSKEIVKAVINFAHNLNIKVIAEYVHNEVVYDIIKKLGIDFAQGFYISKPKPLNLK